MKTTGSPRTTEGSTEPACDKHASDEPAVIMEKLARRTDNDDRAFDIEFWQRQGTAAIMSAMWELVELAWKMKGRDVSELRLQRTVEILERKRR